MVYLLSFLFIVVLISTVPVIVFFVRHTRYLNGRIEHLVAQRNNDEEFFANLLRDFQANRSFPEAMAAAVGRIAEKLEAQSAAIYEVRDGDLVVCAVHGTYPLTMQEFGIGESNAAQLERLRKEPVSLGDGFIGQVARDMYPVLVHDAAVDRRFDPYPARMRISTAMAVPVMEDGRLLGLVAAVRTTEDENEYFVSGDLSELRQLTPQIAVTYELMTGYAEMSRRQRIDQELNFARQIQSSLLPKSFPEWGAFSIHAFTCSAKEVNGDFYDCAQIDEDRMLMVLGDACGKGVPACMLTAMTRSFIRAYADKFTTLQNFLRDLNCQLYRDTDAERFVTLGCCLLDRKTRTIEFGRAGHTELLTYVRKHVRNFYPDGPGLGILPKDLAEFDTFCMAFEPGMSFLLFSDGITEAINTNGEEFGVPRLVEYFKRGCDLEESPDEVLHDIHRAVKHYSPDQADDQTLVLIRHI
ncbi:MAG: SpoIIE family protein phosphatase [Victivallaceae bacterium]|nr:SpoIIE family protein phosphatase [Victivallaceae bacterium]